MMITCNNARSALLYLILETEIAMGYTVNSNPTIAGTRDPAMAETDQLGKKRAKRLRLPTSRMKI